MSGKTNSGGQIKQEERESQLRLREDSEPLVNVCVCEVAVVCITQQTQHKYTQLFLPEENTALNLVSFRAYSLTDDVSSDATSRLIKPDPHHVVGPSCLSIYPGFIGQHWHSSD